MQTSNICFINQLAAEENQQQIIYVLQFDDLNAKRHDAKPTIILNYHLFSLIPHY